MKSSVFIHAALASMVVVLVTLVVRSSTGFSIEPAWAAREDIGAEDDHWRCCYCGPPTLPSGKAQLLGALGFDAEVTSCMAKIVESIDFPRSRSGDVTHTFVPIKIVEEKLK